MSLSSEIIIDVINAFKHLHAVLEDVHLSVVQEDKSLPIWFQPPDSLDSAHLSPREKAFRFIAQFEYIDSQAPKEILLGPGLIATSPKTLLTIQRFNQAKAEFKSSMLSLRRMKIAYNEPSLAKYFEDTLSRRPTEYQETLKRMGLARLHLKQCYRVLPVLEQQPKKASWTWAHTRAIKRITIEKANELLCKQGTDTTIQQQIQKLQSLPSNEPLAIIQELAPHLRTNLLFIDSEGQKQRKMIKGPTPIFYPLEDVEHLPLIKPPSKNREKDADRLPRNDVKLEAEPFLPTIHAHRYRVQASQMED